MPTDQKETTIRVRRKRPIEWPTIGLVFIVYAVIGTLVWFHDSIPWWIILPVGSYFAALHVSLQHEVLHGHPTNKRWLNEAMIFITPHFWLPYQRYRQTHLQHHDDEHLTCPENDPESYYLLPKAWAAMPGLKRTLFKINHTLGGRMLIGPAVSVARFWSSEFLDILAGDAQKFRDWGLFAVSASLMSAYVVACGMPLWQFILLVSYPAISLSLVRSYCEHQAAEVIEERTIIVEASPFWSLLFLNNNLHVAHHERPNLPWYKLPALYRAEQANMIRRNNGYRMNGYGEIFRRYFFKAKEPIPHPNLDWLENPKRALP